MSIRPSTHPDRRRQRTKHPGRSRHGGVDLRRHGRERGGQAAERVAYSNYIAGTVSTTLYDIDSDSLYIQNPSNNGTLALVGALGVDTSNQVGFDISSAGLAYAALTVSGGTG